MEDKQVSNKALGLIGEVNNTFEFFLLDTGATDNFIQDEFIKEMAIERVKSCQMQLSAACGDQIINEWVNVKIKIDNIITKNYFL
ncbi:hypothetical protein HERIO_2199 [Hepatospora eriocheir]|uniref:Peptidase A2 domain-containing protein n=1 Tax=Hepatospora eriocheir TaxID=1081669 RepID=A0A1X0Q7S9_9MICR|nr:hypothetical protein HERIO_2199 [Hepatospora eriocheir]